MRHENAKLYKIKTDCFRVKFKKKQTNYRPDLSYTSDSASGAIWRRGGWR